MIRLMGRIRRLRRKKIKILTKGRMIRLMRRIRRLTGNKIRILILMSELVSIKCISINNEFKNFKL